MNSHTHHSVNIGEMLQTPGALTATMLRLRLVSLVLSIFLAAAALHAQSGTIRVVSTIDLGTLGGTYSRATGINDRGEVVGISTVANGEEHAFLWTARGRMVDLGVLPADPRTPGANAHGINNFGEIVGESVCGINCVSAVIWNTSGAMATRGSLGSLDNQALAINDAGQFGGIATTAACRTCPSHAFIAPIAGGPFQFLGALGTGIHSRVRGLNDLGQAVGSSETDMNSFAIRAFLWTARSGMIDLGSLANDQSEANDINNLGQVVGWTNVGRFGGGVRHAFLWNGRGMIDLGTLIGSGDSEARAINDEGLIAGWSSFSPVSNLRHAVVWQPGVGPRDLETSTDGRTSEAYALNRNMQVVGQVTLPGGEIHAVLWNLGYGQENHPPVAVCGTISRGSVNNTVFGYEGSPVSFTAQQSSDPDGDTLNFQWTFGDGTTGSGGASAFISHIYGDNGSYPVQVTVTDPKGLSSTAPCTARIDNIAPSFPCNPDRGCTGGIPGGAIIQGETFTASASFVDPGEDTWTAVVDYGDGTSPTALALTRRTFSLSHRYTQPGTFVVSVAVTDDDGGSGGAQNRVLVKSWQQTVGEVSGSVAVLASAGILNNGEANALSVKLDAAIKQIDRGNLIPARNELRAFLNQVAAMVQSGRLSQNDGAALAGAVERILAAMD